jgi:nucleotide-binding universal stress UspA family protein
MAAARARRQAWKVLVAVDGSRGSAAALRFTANLATCASGRVIVMTVAASPASRSPELVHANRLVDAATAMLGRVGVRSERRVVTIRPADSIPEAIRRESDRQRADLVVIGSEGRDTLREWVVGGVALRLLYLSRRPVVVVRPPRRRNGSKQLAQSDYVAASIPVYAARQVSRSKGSRRGGGS